MSEKRIITITLVEGKGENDVLVQTRLDPPLPEGDQNDPVVQAAAVALGAIGNYSAGLPHS